MDGRDGVPPEPSNRLLYLVDQGLHITSTTRIALGQLQSNDEIRR
jgi:hypothetical protein